MSSHQPVLVAEVLEGLALVRDGWYVDATYGRGGHSTEILSRLGSRGRLLGIDKDYEAVADASTRFAGEPRISVCHGDFIDLRTLVTDWAGRHPLAGILFDLGVSSPQLDDPRRGFSFQREGPLDMRMNNVAGPTLGQWLARAPQAEIANAIARYGEQPGAHRIAAAIVRARARRPLTTTTELADVVVAAAPRSKSRNHPATRVFQAFRIAINNELVALESALEQAVGLLGVGGRLLVISFHSLEDRIVKQFMARQVRGDPAFAGLPRIPPEARPSLRLVGRLIRPGAEEVAANPRSRSSRLRVAEKIARYSDEGTADEH